MMFFHGLIRLFFLAACTYTGLLLAYARPESAIWECEDAIHTVINAGCIVWFCTWMGIYAYKYSYPGFEMNRENPKLFSLFICTFCPLAAISFLFLYRFNDCLGDNILARAVLCFDFAPICFFVYMVMCLTAIESTPVEERSEGV